MFCSQCGKQVDRNSRFCPACGGPIPATEPFSAAPPPPPRAGGSYAYPAKLTRSRENRMIAGICAGLALRYGWDLNLVRILTVLIGVFTGIGIFVYLAAWVIIPESSYALPAKST